MFTFSRALVSMKPQPLLFAQSRPVLLVIALNAAKSDLFPATIFTGGTSPFICRISASCSIIMLKWSSLSSESAWVMSYTSRKASDFRFEAAHRERYSSWPAVSVRDR